MREATPNTYTTRGPKCPQIALRFVSLKHFLRIGICKLNCENVYSTNPQKTKLAAIDTLHEKAHSHFRHTEVSFGHVSPDLLKYKERCVEKGCDVMRLWLHAKLHGISTKSQLTCRRRLSTVFGNGSASEPQEPLDLSPPLSISTNLSLPG